MGELPTHQPTYLNLTNGAEGGRNFMNLILGFVESPEKHIFNTIVGKLWRVGGTRWLWWLNMAASISRGEISTTMLASELVNLLNTRDSQTTKQVGSFIRWSVFLKWNSCVCHHLLVWSSSTTTPPPPAAATKASHSSCNPIHPRNTFRYSRFHVYIWFVAGRRGRESCSLL